MRLQKFRLTYHLNYVATCNIALTTRQWRHGS